MHLQRLVILTVWLLIYITYASASLDDFVPEKFVAGHRENHVSEICNLATVNMYVRRYVNTFLRYSKLAKKNLDDLSDDDMVHATLHLRLNRKQLEILQKTYNEKNHTPNLEQMDDIFSSIMYNSSTDELMGYLDSVFWAIKFFYYSFDISFTQWAYLTIFTTFGITVATQGFKRRLLVSLSIALFFAEGVNRYFYKLRQAKIKYHQEMKHVLGISDECDPTNYGVLEMMWISTKNVFREDPCVQMQKHQTSHYAEEVSITQSLIEPTLSTIGLVMKYIGIYVNSIGEGMIGTGFGSSIVRIILYPMILVVVIGALLSIFFSKTLAFSTIFGGVNLSQNATNSSTSTELPQQQPQQITEPGYVHDFRMLFTQMIFAKNNNSRPKLRQRNTRRQISFKRLSKQIAIADEQEITDNDDFFDCHEEIN